MSRLRWCGEISRSGWVARSASVGAEGVIGLKLKAPFLAPDRHRDRDHDDDGENAAGEENGFGELVRVSA